MIATLDLLIILITLLIVVAIAISRCIGLTLDDYWVNSRSTNKFTLVCSILSTSIGAGTVVGIVSMSYKGGFVGAFLGLFNALGLLLLGYFFAHNIRRIACKYNCYTLGDFLHLRFSRNCRLAVGMVNLFVYFFFFASQILALGSFLSIITNWNYILSIFSASLIILIYSNVGGLKSDLLTDNIQFFLILILVITLPFFLLSKFHSLSLIYDSVKSLPTGYITGIAYAGTPFLIGAFLFFTPSILVMMDTWQRIFSAESEETARKSLKLSSIIIMPLFFSFSLIGVLGFILFPNINSNNALPYIIQQTLPVGLSGLAFSGFIAALMSTADSMLIVASTTVVRDFYSTLVYKGSDNNHLLKVSKVSSFFIGLISLGFALIFPDIVRVIINGFTSLVILIPSVAGGLIWKRSTSKAAFWSIIAGFSLVIIFLLLIPQYADYAFIPGFVLATTIFILLSFLTKHESGEKIELWYEQ